jgi:CDP-glycerol glycerophosphotransferase
MIVKVSIIIPVYNTELYLDECLISATNQTLQEIEIIVINDASSDNSLAIIKKFQNQDPRIKLIDFTENKGNGYGRNEAIKQATGDYILFLDSDDWLELNTAELTYNKAVKENREVILIGYTQHLTYVKNNKKNKVLYVPSLKDDDPEFFRHFMMHAKGLHTMPWIYLFSRKLLIHSNASFTVGIYFEDIMFTAEALFQAKSIGVLSETSLLYNYRIRKNSITQSLSKKRIDDSFTAHVLLKEFLEKKGVFEKYEKEYLTRFLVFCVFVNFHGYYRMSKSQKDTELDEYMTAIRKSEILSKNNLVFLRNNIIQLAKDDKKTKKVYKIAYGYLYNMKYNFFMIKMSSKIGNFIIPLIYPDLKTS